MATTKLKNAAISGCMGGILNGRGIVGTSTTTPLATDYTAEANVAAAFGTEFTTQNALLAVPMADGDNSEMYYTITAIVGNLVAGRSCSSTTAADYLELASDAVAACKQALSKLS